MTVCTLFFPVQSEESVDISGAQSGHQTGNSQGNKKTATTHSFHTVVASGCGGYKGDLTCPAPHGACMIMEETDRDLVSQSGQVEVSNAKKKHVTQ